MNFVKSFDAPQEWTAFTVPFSDLQPQGKTPAQWEPKLVSWLGFSTASPTPGEVELEAPGSGSRLGSIPGDLGLGVRSRRSRPLAPLTLAGRVRALCEETGRSRGF
jgi:hypothetical protein